MKRIDIDILRDAIAIVTDDIRLDEELKVVPPLVIKCVKTAGGEDWDSSDLEDVLLELNANLPLTGKRTMRVITIKNDMGGGYAIPSGTSMRYKYMNVGKTKVSCGTSLDDEFCRDSYAEANKCIHVEGHGYVVISDTIGTLQNEMSLNMVLSINDNVSRDSESFLKYKYIEDMLLSQFRTIYVDSVVDLGNIKYNKKDMIPIDGTTSSVIIDKNTGDRLIRLPFQLSWTIKPKKGTGEVFLRLRSGRELVSEHVYRLWASKYIKGVEYEDLSGNLDMKVKMNDYLQPLEIDLEKNSISMTNVYNKETEDIEFKKEPALKDILEATIVVLPWRELKI